MGKFFAHVDLTIWPKVSVVVFGLVFIAIVTWTFLLASSERYQRGASLPLDED